MMMVQPKPSNELSHNTDFPTTVWGALPHPKESNFAIFLFEKISLIHLNTRTLQKLDENNILK